MKQAYSSSAVPLLMQQYQSLSATASLRQRVWYIDQIPEKLIILPQEQ